jgi:hypothetical protein
VSKIGGGAKDSEAHIANMCDESRQSQRRIYGHNPEGWREFWPQGFVARLANIRDIGCAALRALKQNRASAGMGFIVLGTLNPRRE